MNANNKIESDYADYAEYIAKLSEIMKTATELGTAICSGMFELACLNRLKEWSDNQPVGTVKNVKGSFLRNTGDKNIDLLWNILDTIMDVRQTFTARYGNRSSW